MTASGQRRFQRRPRAGLSAGPIRGAQPEPTVPVWCRLAYDGTNCPWSFSLDGQHWTLAFTVSGMAYLGLLTLIGVGIYRAQPTSTAASTRLHLMSWQRASIA